MSDKKKEKISPRALVKIIILFVIVIGIILIPFIYSATTYIKAWNNNKISPFSPTVTVNDDSTTTEKEKITGLKLDNVERIEHKDFDKFDVTFEIANYDDVNKKEITFTIKIKKNDNTPEELTTVDNSSTNLVKTGVCVCANWIGFESYQSSLQQYNNSYITNNSARTASVKCDTKFPAKASTWPIKVTVDSPEIYLYLYYRTQENALYVDHSYILHYTYFDVWTENTKGGIIK